MFYGVINIVPHNKKFDTKTEKEICEKYKNGKTTQELADEYGYKTRKSISDILKRYNVPRRNVQDEQRKNTPYSNFSLKKIDSKEKAYFLGLLLTDGYVIEGKHPRDASLIGISLTDIDAINAIKELTNASIYKVPIRDKMTKNAYRINLYGKRFIEEVRRFGLHPKKTYDLSKIRLFEDEEKYFPYILRGIIDGDGWIRKDGKEFFISSASKSFIEYLVEQMRLLGFDVSYNFFQNEFNGYYLIRSAKKENIKLLKEIVYDTPYGMKQKFNKLHNL